MAHQIVILAYNTYLLHMDIEVVYFIWEELALTDRDGISTLVPCLPRKANGQKME
jgi:hypothetical protein